MILHQPPIAAGTVVVSYLADPIIGWTGETLLRRMTKELRAVRDDAVARQVQLATTQERDRVARAVHGRVLATLDVLARPPTTANARLGDRIAEQAVLLRRITEGDHAGHSEDIWGALAAVARVAERAGLPTSIEDSVRVGEPTGNLRADAREALIQATDQTLSAMAGRVVAVVLRIRPEDNGVLVTLQARGPAELPDPEDIAAVARRIADAGGVLRIASLQYVELWVPGHPKNGH